MIRRPQPDRILADAERRRRLQFVSGNAEMRVVVVALAGNKGERERVVPRIVREQRTDKRAFAGALGSDRRVPDDNGFGSGGVSGQKGEEPKGGWKGDETIFHGKGSRSGRRFGK